LAGPIPFEPDPCTCLQFKSIVLGMAAVSTRTL